jgi:hypothetical protein
MKWAIYNPKIMKYVHPAIYKDPLTKIEWNIIEWDSLPYFFDGIYDIEMYLRGVDENGNECVQLEGCLYMMCMEQRP